jgi:predicted small lipoprotein YifL
MLKMGLRWVLGALLIAGLSACGQMGPLYMPKDEPVKTSPAPDEAATPEPAATPTPSK